MKQLQLTLASLIFALVTQTPYAAGQPEGVVYSANEGDNSISEIELGNPTVRTTKVPIVPHNVQVTPDGKALLAVGMPVSSHAMHDMNGMRPMETGAQGDMHEKEPQGNLLVIDPHRLDRILATLPAGHHPAHVVMDLSGKRAYITSSEDNQVTVVDIGQRRVVGTVPTGAFPHGLRLSPDSRELYVANVADNSVSVIDTRSLTEAARIPVGRAPVQVGFTPDGKRVYVSLRDDNQVAVIDTTTRRVTSRIPVGRNPIQVYVTPDGSKVYVANQGSGSDPDNRVSVIDVASGQLMDTVVTGAGAHGVVASSDGTSVFVTNTRDNTVSAIDTGTQRVIATYDVGSNPNGITYRALR
ncbi:beta-propeller fold lactonase family protein (plasmid) [Burkholderia thailandensis]|uniref:YVTN family beta-propeller repeat protein n=1 Tax=Burkholderia thailandensis TaxID=57975 RepID=UPI00192D3DD5|nr:cytochrome D1 domain-containing protein [Burkholderia thailandensis]MBS2132133.1 beta-propeller fold lactonase family protein [Burkholderia thailandensis]QRA15239.1 beta-propeller fold lactonase family protein [Burkholderia thailandensis]